MTNQQQEWLDLAKNVALEPGDIMQKYFGKKPDSHFKTNRGPQLPVATGPA